MAGADACIWSAEVCCRRCDWVGRCVPAGDADCIIGKARPCISKGSAPSVGPTSIMKDQARRSEGN